MKKQKVPSNFNLIYSRKQIADRISKMGEEISSWITKDTNHSDDQVLAICILRGGVFFFSDLLKEISFSMEPTFCRCMSYSSESNTADEQLRLVVKPAELTDRTVLLIDDICDSGRTLKKLCEYAKENGAHCIKTAVLIHRIHQESSFTPDFAAFPHQGDEWFVGYGMEDKNHYSNLPDVYTLASR